MTFDLEQIASLTGGRLCPSGADGVVMKVSTDSRKIAAGDLFVPLRGERFDGHDYLAEAVRRGASACLSEEIVAGLSVPVIVVPDTLRALGDLAAAVRREFDGPVIGVTGSSGKTTTKEMMASILDRGGQGLKSPGNFNNLIGLPLTVLDMEARHEWAILEMGMSALGEIARLCEIAAPQIGVLTNVGLAHIETLHGLEGVARAKGELFAALPRGGTAIVNVDDARVRALPVANGVKQVFYGFSPDAQVRGEEISSEDGRVRFRLCFPEGERLVRLSVPGRHNVANALAAAAAARAAGASLEDAVQGLEAFEPEAGRMHIVRLANDSLLLDDSYNSNPLSVEAALSVLNELPGTGRKIAVLGDMLELGTDASELHRDVGREAGERTDILFAYGEYADRMVGGAVEQGMAENKARVAPDHEMIVNWLKRHLQAGDRVLVKGSRGMQMDRICCELQDQNGRRAAG